MKVLFERTATYEITEQCELEIGENVHLDSIKSIIQANESNVEVVEEEDKALCSCDIIGESIELSSSSASRFGL